MVFYLNLKLTLSLTGQQVGRYEGAGGQCGKHVGMLSWGGGQCEMRLWKGQSCRSDELGVG